MPPRVTTDPLGARVSMLMPNALLQDGGGASCSKLENEMKQPVCEPSVQAGMVLNSFLAASVLDVAITTPPRWAETRFFWVSLPSISFLMRSRRMKDPWLC